MHKMLGNLEFVTIYLKDVLITSKSTGEHFADVGEVLRQFKRNNVIINGNKSEFF